MRVRVLLLLTAPLAIAGCGSRSDRRSSGDGQFRVRDLAKSDVDTVAEIHLAEVRKYLRELMEKLYRRNPREWRRTGKPSAEFVTERVFRGSRVPDFVELGGARGTDAVQLAFTDDYAGDRILALVAGLASMIDAAYDDKREFFVLDELDPQKLYNSARNVEIAAWKLANDRDPAGAPYVLSNSLPEESRNLSFERLLGKIIAVQDTLALIISGRTNRTIRKVIQRVAGAVFLPI